MKLNIAFSTVSRAREHNITHSPRQPRNWIRSNAARCMESLSVAYCIDRSGSLCSAIDHFGVRLPSVRYSFALHTFNHDIQCVPVPCKRANAIRWAPVPLILCIRSEISKRKCIQQTSRSWHSGVSFRRPGDGAFSIVFTVFSSLLFSWIQFDFCACA